MTADFKLLIDGKLVDGDAELDVINPANEAVIARCARASAAQLDQQWGFSGSIWSTDRDLAHSLAVRMEAGTVWINKHLDFGPTTPFGGAKQSGLGIEFAEEGLHEFTQLQIVNEAR